MDDSLYDDFGNYIGPDIESDQESDRKYDGEDEAEIYGHDVEILVMDEDEQNFEQPIIKPVRNIKSEVIKPVTMSPLIT
ncbi:116 kDa U5 small nuclear ribonucleoprotein component, N-terminal [Trema orientale]|uniref:116 kDa U5 small nuclear ribonucleoprotein component, N-terminal n=1 Tax=Trema orientale TaxID=63057 RepID=A0A2P5BXJ8_TREOI|nr:116 kDa U5 small nuclear ribonucleoprotein component, N-terminal [Trema orientale]